MRNKRDIRYDNHSKVKEEKIFTFETVLFLFLIAAICISILSWQNYRINRTDIEISKLEAQLKEAKMLNDSLEGKLLAKRDLKKVQRIATEKYGMIKPNNSYFVAVDVNPDNKETVSSAVGTNTQNSSDTNAFSKLLGNFVSD